MSGASNKPMRKMVTLLTLQLAQLPALRPWGLGDIDQALIYIILCFLPLLFFFLSLQVQVGSYPGEPGNGPPGGWAHAVIGWNIKYMSLV